jgi:hypothetical protein
MSLLAPLFMLGAVALALPVIFHLVRRTTRERRLFGSLMFLRPAPPRLTRRNRLEDLLLLLLRSAAILLLAVGFSRPLLKRAQPAGAAAGAPRRMVVLLDSSASMRRGDLWPAARDKAESILRSASAGDQVALFTFDRQLNSLVSFEQWNATPPENRASLVHQRLAEANPGWSATYVDQALIRAAEMVGDLAREKVAALRQVVLITDLQAGSRLSALQGFDWPKGVDLIVESVAPRAGSNAGVHWIADRGETAPAAESTVRVRVSNEPDSRREQFQVGWARADGALASNATDVYVPPGQSRAVALPAPAAESGLDRIVLRGDDEVFDNTVFVAPPEPVRVEVLYLGSDSETDTRQPLYFLRRAFQQTRRQSVRVVAHQPSATLLPAEVETAALVIVTDNLPGAQATVLAEQVRRGKTLLFAPTRSAAAPTLAAILGLEAASLTEAAPSGYAMLSEIDFRHPLFVPFADARYNDFTPIHFWKYRRLDPDSLAGSRVLARFDRGDAAMLEAPVGKGRVIVFASGWHPADSQLALSSKFVPLLYSLLETSGAASPAPAQCIVGDALPLPEGLITTNMAIMGPDGTAVSVAAGASNGVPALIPGIYRVKGGPVGWRCAVNLDAAESRTAPLPVEELERFGAPASSPTLSAPGAAALQARLQNAELESRQKLWRWFVVATLVVLLTETWLAGRTTRRLAAPGGVSV